MQGNTTLQFCGPAAETSQQYARVVLRTHPVHVVACMLEERRLHGLGCLCSHIPPCRANLVVVAACVNTCRYTGGMVPDVFQIIVKEKGVFTNVISPSTKAKLRILFEVAPLALMVEQVRQEGGRREAGGRGTEGCRGTGGRRGEAGGGEGREEEE